MKKTKVMDVVTLKKHKQIKTSRKISKTRITNKTADSGLQQLTSQLHGIQAKHNQKTAGKIVVAIIHQWNNLSPDLLRLVIDKLNYEERIHFRAVCKGWSCIQTSTKDLVHDIPINAIVEILMKSANNRFQDFFNFFIYWIKHQTHKTIKALLDQTPIQQLYHWGYEVNRPKESMFTYFMTMSQSLGNNDAEFYWASKSIILRNHIYYDILDYSYTIIEHTATKGHMISLLFKNMLDIYFFPKKRHDAVIVLIDMITSPATKNTITGMIMALKSIAGEIYPETIFGPLSGKPICNYSYPNNDIHYQPDGYPVHPRQIDDYTCLQCKVALLFGCLSTYLTPTLDFHLNFY